MGLRHYAASSQKKRFGSQADIVINIPWQCLWFLRGYKNISGMSALKKMRSLFTFKWVHTFVILCHNE